MSEETESRTPKNFKEAEEWLEEMKVEGVMLHLKLENLKVAKQLNLLSTLNKKEEVKNDNN